MSPRRAFGPMDLKISTAEPDRAITASKAVSNSPWIFPPNGQAASTQTDNRQSSFGNIHAVNQPLEHNPNNDLKRPTWNPTNMGHPPMHPSFPRSQMIGQPSTESTALNPNGPRHYYPPLGMPQFHGSILYRQPYTMAVQNNHAGYPLHQPIGSSSTSRQPSPTASIQPSTQPPSPATAHPQLGSRYYAMPSFNQNQMTPYYSARPDSLIAGQDTGRYWPNHGAYYQR